MDEYRTFLSWSRERETRAGKILEEEKIRTREKERKRKRKKKKEKRKKKKEKRKKKKEKRKKKKEKRKNTYSWSSQDSCNQSCHQTKPKHPFLLIIWWLLVVIVDGMCIHKYVCL